MTGEISLSGLILPVGGIKNKVLAAQQKGVCNIILPKDNESDVLELQKFMELGDLNFHYVAHVTDLLQLVFKPQKSAVMIRLNPKI